MVKSSQLRPQDLCHGGSVKLIKRTQSMIRAAAQKNILNRVLRGEDIDDYKSELRSILVKTKAKFENYEQEKMAIELFSKRIEKYADYYKNMSDDLKLRISFPEQLTENDFIVLGEKHIVPDFDYITEDDTTVNIVKVKTSRAKNPITYAANKNDMLAIGLWAENKWADKNINIRYDFLADRDAATEKNNEDRPYDYRNSKSFIKEVTDEFIDKLQEAYNEQLEEHGACSPEDCAGCGRNQLCHFEEPPINMGTERQIKPISDIRLTMAQRDIIDFESGIARTIAGAGAGKTLVVAMRVVELIKKGYDPRKICLLTFTKTGAQEMTDRVVRYLAGQEAILEDPDKITSTTINAFCQNIINDHYEELGYAQAPRVIPDEVKSGIINRILNTYAKIPEWKYGFTPTGPYAKYVKTALTSAKDTFALIKTNNWTVQNHEFDSSYSHTSIAMIFMMYNEFTIQMKQRCLIDYDDQLGLVFELLEKNPNLFEEYGYEHIIVDEFQDTDLKQINLINKMIDANSFKSFMAVGDDSQSIFGFRNTSPEFIVNFGNYFGVFTDFHLVENHRSSRNIVDNANKINQTVEDRVEKDLVPTQEAGTPVEVQGFYSQLTEYNFIADDILNRINNGQEPSTIAVLASDKFELTGLASALTKRGIPSILMNPIPYKQNSRVAAICDFYDSFINGTSKGLVEYKNVLEKGSLKDATDEQLDEIVNELKTTLLNRAILPENFRKLAEALDEEKTDECYQDFLDKISYCRTMEELDEFFGDFELYGSESMFKREGHYNGVCLITVHSAKGMEWDTTYLTLSKFDKPKFHTMPGKCADEINETRRKWFVGATRAKKDLICTGQYVLRHSLKEGVILNSFLRDAYYLQDKIYDYNSVSFFNQRAAEAEAEKEER